MLKSIRILLAIVAHYDYEIWKMDVKTTFLNGNLFEDVYMHKRKALHLKMAISYASCKDPFMD